MLPLLLETVEVNQRPDASVSGVNSHAADGNILEAINLSLSSFEKNNEDRNFVRSDHPAIVYRCVVL